MIDSYLTLHHDYLVTDSITKAEDLKVQLDKIEKEMKIKGCQIIYSTEKWQEYICKLPELKQYNLIVPDIFKEASQGLDGQNAAVLIECLRLVENTIFKTSGKRVTEQRFYSNIDVIEIIDGTTLIKNINFTEFDITQAINKLKS